MSLSRDQLARMMRERIRDPDLLRALWREVPGSTWRELQAESLTRTLTRALDAPFWRTRVSLTPAQIAAEPFAAVLRFPPLRKRDYWEQGPGLRLPAPAADHVFHTSGTEGGTPTEQPWDSWSFDKSFGESSAVALGSVGARAGERMLIGSPAFGAVGMAFTYAAELFGLQTFNDAFSFSDAHTFETTLARLREGVELLVGPPGSLLLLVHRLRLAGIEPRELGVRAIVSGVGTFLGARQVDFLVESFAPQVIHEMGGKNEILHAPGGRRYLRADHPEGAGACSEPGMLHLLPWAAHVVAVEREAFGRGEELVPAGHGREGVLLMTRLSAAGTGCAAFVNDAGDFGRTRGFAGVDAEPSPCGATMPAFAFGGRVGQGVTNKLGDQIFTDETLRALSLGAADAGLDVRAAASLRVQVLILHAADPLAPDAMYWIIGARADTPLAALERVGQRWLEHWPRTSLYRGEMAGIMGFGGFAVVEREALPHAGRDKPQYPPSLELRAAPGETQMELFERHLEQRLRARVLVRVQLDGSEG